MTHSFDKITVNILQQTSLNIYLNNDRFCKITIDLFIDIKNHEELIGKSHQYFVNLDAVSFHRETTGQLSYSKIL